MRRAASLFLLLLVAACGSSIPTFPGPMVDSGIECTSSSDAGPARACPSGHVCLVGRCYAQCTMDAQCSASETCTMGVCASRSGPRPDGGPMDGGADLGPPDMGLCGAVTCTDPANPVCHPVTGACVQCAASDGCASASAPACDLAQGVCRPFVAQLCAPCRASVDCGSILAGFTFECIMHARPFERVCLAVCGAGGVCPMGQRCDTDNHCIPNIGSCTSWVSAAQSRGCGTDAECAPLGATGADFLYPGMCSGGTCHQPCGLDADCQVAGQVCSGGTICM